MHTVFSSSATTSSLLAAALRKAQRCNSENTISSPELQALMKPAAPPLPVRGLSFSLSSDSGSQNNSTTTPTPSVTESPRGPLPAPPNVDTKENDAPQKSDPDTAKSVSQQAPPQTVKVVFKTPFLGVQFKWEEKNSCCVLHKFANVRMNGYLCKLQLIYVLYLWFS